MDLSAQSQLRSTRSKGSRRGRPRKNAFAPESLFQPRAPFRAEMPKKKFLGVWRDHIEQALDDARKLGSGARVVSFDGTMMAKFENAARYATPHYRERPNQRTP